MREAGGVLLNRLKITCLILLGDAFRLTAILKLFVVYWVAPYCPPFLVPALETSY